MATHLFGAKEFLFDHRKKLTTELNPRDNPRDNPCGQTIFRGGYPYTPTPRTSDAGLGFEEAAQERNLCVCARAHARDQRKLQR